MMFSFNAKEEMTLYKYISENLQTPCYIFDFDVFSETVQKIKLRLAENVSLCFSLKSNPWLVAKAAECADMIETCSQGEVEICRRNLSGKLENVLYGGIAKEESDITYALESGITKLSIESVQQLETLSHCVEQFNVKPKVLLRITSGNQFGLNIDETLSLFAENRFPNNLEFAGIHYFSGTQKTDAKSVERDFNELTQILEKIGHIGISEVEYGAGIGVDYFGDKSNDEVWDKTICFINGLSKKYKITYESGRALSADCGKYIAKIVEARNRGNKEYYITNGGKHQIQYYSGLFSKMKTPKLSVVTEEPQEETTNAVVVGSLCTAGDILANESELPKAKQGDYIVFHRCGGYSVTENIALFLTRDFPTVYSIENGQLGILRKGKGVIEHNSK